MDKVNATKIIYTGNAAEEGKKRGGWFIGNFIPPTELLRSNKDVEIKWGIHPKGEIRSSQAPTGEATTVSILLSGEYKLVFQDEEIVLSQQGDYVMFRPNRPHSCEALQDTVIITIRWPSLSKE